MELKPFSTSRGVLLMEESVYNCLAIPEVLDCILSYLPTTSDLLLARSVCKSWNDLGNEFLIKAHLSKLIIKLRHTGSRFGVKEFLTISNSLYVSPFFQQLQNYIIDYRNNYDQEFQRFELVDIPQLQNLFTKYSDWIKSIELLANYSNASVLTEFVLHKEVMNQLTNLQQLKISASITPEFLQSSAFDISQIARLSSFELGAAKDLSGHNKLLEILSRSKVGSNNNLNSIILGGLGKPLNPLNLLNVTPGILEGLFKNLPQLQVFHNYGGGGGGGETRFAPPRFYVGNQHLQAMTSSSLANDDGAKLKELKLKMSCRKHSDNNVQAYVNNYWQLLNSYSKSLESISLTCDGFHVESSNDRHQTCRHYWNNLPKLPMLTSLELSSCTNTSLLASTPNLVELSMIDPLLDCFNEFGVNVIDCLTLKSLTIQVGLCRSSLKDVVKAQLEFVQKVTSSFRNLEEFVMEIRNGWEVVRLELGLKRVEVEDILFNGSPFIKQVEYYQLAEYDVQDLEESKDFMNPIVNIILTNCHKFLGLDGAVKHRVLNHASVCLLSSGFRYKNIKKNLASTRQRLTTKTNPRFTEYRFVKLDDSELPTFFLLLKNTSSSNTTTTYVSL